MSKITKAKRRGTPRRPRAGKPGKRKGSRRRTSSRLAKARILDRIRQDTQEVNSGTLVPTLRRQGYEELPLEEIQDRLTKLRTTLSEFILAERG
jgi:hypothetical protein